MMWYITRLCVNGRKFRNKSTLSFTDDVWTFGRGFVKRLCLNNFYQKLISRKIFCFFYTYSPWITALSFRSKQPKFLRIIIEEGFILDKHETRYLNFIEITYICNESNSKLSLIGCNLSSFRVQMFSKNLSFSLLSVIAFFTPS